MVLRRRARSRLLSSLLLLSLLLLPLSDELLLLLSSLLLLLLLLSSLLLLLLVVESFAAAAARRAASCSSCKEQPRGQDLGCWALDLKPAEDRPTDQLREAIRQGQRCELCGCSETLNPTTHTGLAGAKLPRPPKLGYAC